LAGSRESSAFWRGGAVDHWLHVHAVLQVFVPAMTFAPLSHCTHVPVSVINYGLSGVINTGSLALDMCLYVIFCCTAVALRSDKFARSCALSAFAIVVIFWSLPVCLWLRVSARTRRHFTLHFQPIMPPITANRSLSRCSILGAGTA
jgi:hypothetical protein